MLISDKVCNSEPEPVKTPGVTVPCKRREHCVVQELRQFEDDSTESNCSRVPSFQQRFRGAYVGALVADMLCVPLYRQTALHRMRKVGTSSRRWDAIQPTSHRTGTGSQGSGDLSIYGWYNVLVLKYIAKARKLDSKGLKRLWAKHVAKWSLVEACHDLGWKQCQDTRATLLKVDKSASNMSLEGRSNALSIRSVASMGLYHTEEAVVQASHTTVLLTQNQETARQAAGFFSQVGFRVVRHMTIPRDAIEEVAAATGGWVQTQVNVALDKVHEALNSSSALAKQKQETIDHLALTSMGQPWTAATRVLLKGKSSAVVHATRAAVYLIVRYGRLLDAANANAMVGGDSVARAAAIGMVLGGNEGELSIPLQLRTSIKDWFAIDAMLSDLPLLQKNVTTFT